MKVPLFLAVFAAIAAVFVPGQAARAQKTEAAPVIASPAVLPMPNPPLVKSTPPSETKSGARIWRDLAYVPGGHKRQKLDFYAPTNSSGGAGPWPCVVYMHGGGWENGGKRGNTAFFLCFRGYAVASIDYRLSGDAPFPAQIEDCKAAVRYLRTHAAQFNIDPKRIGASGNSAGGHLAALLGTSVGVKAFDKGAYLGESSAVQAVADFYGPTDLSFYGPSQPGDILSRFIGGLTQNNKEKVQAANPITHVDSGDPPFAIFHGDADPIVPQKHSEALRDSLQRAKVPVTLTIVKGGSHGFKGADQKAAQAETTAFFNKYLKK